MYCWALLSQRKVLPESPGRLKTDSSTGLVVAFPFAGVSQIGALLACTTWPDAFLSWNFTGTVLPLLKMLGVLEAVCPVSSIGCRNLTLPVQPPGTSPENESLALQVGV